MFKNMKLATKITSGFGLVITFLIIVGITGFWSLKKTIKQIDVMTEQLEIVKNTNQAKSLSQSGQANSLRYIIYEDEKYLNASQEMNLSAIDEISKAKEMMKSAENRNNADAVANSAKSYINANNEYAELFKKKSTIGTIRAEAASKALNQIKELIARRKQFLQEHSSDSDKGKVTEYDLVEKALLAQEAGNAFNQVYIWAYKYLLALTPEQEEAAAKEWISEIQATKNLLERCQSEMTDSESKQNATSALQAVNTYSNQVEGFRQINDDQRNIQLKKLKPAADSLMTDSEAVLNGVYAFIDNTRKEANAQISLANILINVISISAMIIGILAAIIITRSITKPINRIIVGLTEGSEQVAAASGQVSSASQSLAEGATEQAAGLEETSSSLEEMSAMTKQNADNAQQANTLAAEAKKSASTGTDSMVRMNKAIQDIQKSSDETAKIIKVIDEIAFQTNLLALNAAVEAARAGEAGKGFAVVAEEVRNLAMRSADAAKNTANMIEESVKNARNGVDIATEVGKVLDEIVSSVGKTTDLISEIAAASAEQAQGIDQVNTAVSQMDKVTQQNAANAEESASASEELSAQAEQMDQIVQELAMLVGGNNTNTSSISSNSSRKRKVLKTTKRQSSSLSNQVFHDIAQNKAAKNKTSVRSKIAIPLEDDNFNSGFDEFNN